MEKKLIRIFVLFCLVAGFTTKSIAQSLSTYEQKRYELADKTLSDMAEEDASIALVWVMLRAQYIEENGPFEDFMSDVYFTESIIEAIGLGSSFMGTDSWVEYAQKQIFKQIYQTWKLSRETIDKTRTTADIDHERRLKAGSIQSRKGTVNDLIIQLRKEYGKWAKKGEYEKTIKYEHRLNTKGVDYFDSLCVMLSNKIWEQSQYANFSNEKYDADREVWSVTLTYGDSIVGKKQILGECKMPIEIAKTFSAKDLFLMEAQVVDGLVIPLKLSTWIKVKEIYQRYDFEFNKVPGATALNICLNDIGFNYTGNIDTLQKHCFSLTDYYQKKNSFAHSLYEIHLQTKRNFYSLKREYINAAAKYKGYTSYRTDFSNFDEWFKKPYKKQNFEFMAKCLSDTWCYGVKGWETKDISEWLSLSLEDIEWFYYKEPHRHQQQYTDLLGYIDSSFKRLESKILRLESEILQKLNDITTEQFNQIDLACINGFANKSQFSILYPIGTATSYSNQGRMEQMYFEGKIKKVIIKDDSISFIISKKEQINCKLYVNNLRLANNSLYSGEKRNDILCNNEGTIILYHTSINRYRKRGIVLIVNEKLYILSDAAQQKLFDNGFFKESKTSKEDNIRF